MPILIETGVVYRSTRRDAHFSWKPAISTTDYTDSTDSKDIIIAIKIEGNKRIARFSPVMARYPSI